MRTSLYPFACLAALCAAPLSGASDLDNLKEDALRMVDDRKRLTQEMVDSVFSFAELGYQETETSAYLTGILEREGFSVERGVAGMPTAFVATWGSGRPVIGFMADLDCVPGASQTPGVAYHLPLVEGAPGHGEGHNSGQAVNVTAALVVKELMQHEGIEGTLKVYPGVAEELVGGKTYLILAGLFEGVDAVLGAHISTGFNTGYGPRGTGLVSTRFTFHGRSGHAAVAPWLGLSALDAVELMDVGWNFRREHLPLNNRSHYVIVEGGDQPNVIPDRATVWYFFRGTNYEEIRAVHEIGQQIAEGAAMMTGTTVEERVLSATWPRYFNKPLAEALYANIERVGMPVWSGADETLARAAQRELNKAEKGMNKQIGRLTKNSLSGGSDDIGDVSWNVPTVVLRYPGNIPGMIMHHWSRGISMATPIAHKGATAGAKAQALTALDILHDPDLVRAAHAFLSEQTGERPWESLVPENTSPPTFLNEEKMGEFRDEMKKYYYDPERFDTYLDQLDITYPTTR